MKDYRFNVKDDGGLEILADGKPLFGTDPAGEILPSSVIRDGNTAELTFDAQENCPALTVRIRQNGQALHVLLSGEGDFAGDFRYPLPFASKPGDTLLYPYYEGFAFKAEDGSFCLSDRMNLSGAILCMAFWGILREGNWLLCAVITNLDAQLVTTSENGLTTSRVVWIPEKGKWGYTREIRYLVGEGGITELCMAYRAIADEKGLRIPFTAKEDKLPALNRLIGAADVWLWNDDAMDKLYSENAVYHVPSAEQLARRVQIAEDMKKNGMDNVLWSIFDENIDLETVERVKSLGYITTVYDVYTDVIPKPIEHLIPDTRRERCKQRIDWWPDGIQVQKNGELMPAWQLKGKDGVFRHQNKMCDAAAVDCASKFVPEQTKKYKLDGRFIDVTYGGFGECYSKVHPMTRRDSLHYKRELFRMLGELGLFRGTEVGCEDGAPDFEYNEGLLSAARFRQADAGRRMTHLYEGDQIRPEIRGMMLNPRVRVPLWELVYHGCVQSYWYWGDSANCMPELTALRDLFCRLWGLPELYSFRAADWEKLKPLILDSYRRTTPLAVRVGRASLDRFEILDEEGLVQRTTFSDGTVVTANFSEDDFNSDGRVIPAGEAVVFD